MPPTLDDEAHPLWWSSWVSWAGIYNDRLYITFRNGDCAYYTMPPLQAAQVLQQLLADASPGHYVNFHIARLRYAYQKFPDPTAQILGVPPAPTDFTATGTYTAQTTHFDAEIWAAGAPGADGNALTGGPGGASGGYARKEYFPAIGDIFNLTISNAAGGTNFFKDLLTQVATNGNLTVHGQGQLGDTTRQGADGQSLAAGEGGAGGSGSPTFTADGGIGDANNGNIGGNGGIGQSQGGRGGDTGNAGQDAQGPGAGGGGGGKNATGGAQGNTLIRVTPLL